MLIVDFGPRMDDRDVEAIKSLVRTAGRAPRVIEVGSWLGASALAMLEAGATEIHCVDTWHGTDDAKDETFRAEARYGEGAIFEAFCQNVGSHLGRSIFPHRGPSLFWAESWSDADPVDLIFIDADHRYPAVLSDIRAWSKHVRPGKILCGHDYSEGWPGVVRAVDETGGTFSVLGCSVWWRIL